MSPIPYGGWPRRGRALHGLLIAAALLVALRLPPGQSLLAALAEVWIGHQLQGTVEIGRLRTNLWDEAQVQDVAIAADAGAVHIDALRLHFSGGPLSPDIDEMHLYGIHLRPGSSSAQTSSTVPSPTDPTWLPPRLSVTDVTLTLFDGAPIDLQGTIQLNEVRDSLEAVRRWTANGDSLLVQHGDLQQRLHIEATMEAGRRAVELRHLLLVSAADTLRGEAFFEAGAFTSQLSISATSRLNRWLPSTEPHVRLHDSGAVRIDARAHGLVSDPAAHIAVAANKVHVADIELASVQLRGTWTGESLALDTVVVVGADSAVIAGWAHAATGDSVRVDARVHLSNVNMHQVGALLPDASVIPEQGDLSGRVTFRAPGPNLPLAQLETDLTMRHTRWRGLDLGTVEASAQWNGVDVDATVTSQLIDLSADGTLRSAQQHAIEWTLSEIDLQGIDGWAGVRPLLGVGSAHVRTSGPWQRPQVDASLSLRNLRLGGAALARFDATAQLDTSGQFHLKVSDAGVATTIEAKGSLRDGQLHVGRLQMAEASLSDHLAGPASQQWNGRLSASFDVQGNFREPQATGALRVEGLSLRGQSFGDVELLVQLASGRAQATVAALDSTMFLRSSVDVNRHGWPFQLEGTLHQAPLQPFLALLSGESLGYGGDLQAELRGSGLLSDPEQLRGSIDLQQINMATPAGALHLTQAARLNLRKGVVAFDTVGMTGTAGSMRVAGHVARTGPIQLHYVLDDLGMDFIEPFVTDNDLHLRGRLRGAVRVSGTSAAPRLRGRIEVASLGVVGRKFGDLSATMQYRGATVRLDSLGLTLPAGGSLHGTAEVPLTVAGRSAAERRWRATLEAHDAVVDSGQGLPDSVRVELRGGVELSGRGITHKDLTGRLRLNRLAVSRGSFGIASQLPLELRLQDGYLTVADSAAFSLSGVTDSTSTSILRVHGSTESRDSLTVTVRQAPLANLLGLAGVDRQISGIADLQASLRGVVSAPRWDVRLAIPDARVDSVAVADVELRWRSGAARRQQLDVQGGFSDGHVQLHADLPATASIDSTWRLHAQVDGVDLAPARFWFRATDDALHHLAGRLDGEFHVEAGSGLPQYNGLLRITDGSLGVGGLRPLLEFHQADVRLSQDSLTVSGLQDPSDTWRIAADVRLNRAGQIVGFATSLDLQDLQLELPKTGSLTTSGHLQWNGTSDSSIVSGALHVPQGHVTEQMSLRNLAFAGTDTTQAKRRAEWLERVGLAITLDAQNLRLDNELATIPFAADLVLSGTAAQPILDGEFIAGEGRLSYLGHNFVTERVHVVFDRGRPMDDLYMLFHDPARLDPTLDMRASTELKADNGNEYDVFLELSGAYTEIDVRLLSDPPEEQMDVLSLLRFGRTGVPMLDPRSGMLRTDADLSPDALLSATESGFGRVLGLDNVAIDNSVLRPGRLAGSRIVLTKQLGKRTEMTYSTTVGYAAEGRVQLQYNLGYGMFVQTEHDAQGESGVDVNLKLKFR